MFKLILTTLISSFVYGNTKYLNPISTSFTNYIKTYNKLYDDIELFDRYVIFTDNLKVINEHNSKNTNTWKMGINQFTDLSPYEFKKQLCYHNKMSYNVPRIILDFKNVQSTSEELDWTKLGAVTPVKNQGQCGSCWAFSSTGSLESAYYLKHNILESFSEQQLVDCSSSYGNEGCNGGLMDLAFDYVKDNGICRENDYKYVAQDKACKTCTSVTKINGYVDVVPNNEDALLKAVNIKPISVAIEADQMSFQFYSSGVLTSKCGTDLDHGVLLVGYGTLNGIDYWKVKNSWGSSWGDNGYILLERNVKNKEGKCGIAMSPSYPIIE